HQCFSLVHGLNDSQIRKPLMCYFLLKQCARDHTDNFSTPFKCSVRKGTHQSDPSAAVDDRDFLRNKLRRKRDSSTGVAWAAADTGATENTETFPHIGVERPLVRLISKPDK